MAETNEDVVPTDIPYEKTLLNTIVKNTKETKVTYELRKVFIKIGLFKKY